MGLGEIRDGLAQTVSLSGVDIATYVDGEPGRPWIVLSNSLAADSSSWEHQLSLLTQNFRVLRYDTRGHGRSSVPEGPYTFEHLTGDVLGLMDHYGIEKADFLGLSMGGMTGLGLAIDHPSRVTRLICCDARSDAPPPFVDNWTARIASVESAGNMAPVAAFNKERWFTPAFIASHPQVIDKTIDHDPRDEHARLCRMRPRPPEARLQAPSGPDQMPNALYLRRSGCSFATRRHAGDERTRPGRRHQTGRSRGPHLQHREPRGLQHDRQQVAVALKRLFLERPPASDRS